MGLEPTTFCMAKPAMFAPVRARNAQTACLQHLQPSERNRPNASERRTLPFLPLLIRRRDASVAACLREPSEPASDHVATDSTTARDMTWPDDQPAGVRTYSRPVSPPLRGRRWGGRGFIAGAGYGQTSTDHVPLPSDSGLLTTVSGHGLDSTSTPCRRASRVRPSPRLKGPIIRVTTRAAPRWPHPRVPPSHRLTTRHE
jgi:hypothetical protein